MTVTVVNIHHVTQVVTDVDRAIEFYSLFGFEPVPRPAGMRFPGAWLQLRNQMIHLVDTGEAPVAGPQHFAMAVEDLDGAVAELRAAGVDVPDPKPVAGFGRQVAFKDPDGNGLEMNDALRSNVASA